MSKLPPEFVKAPASPSKPRSRPSRRTSLISPEPVCDPRELVLQLTDEEYQALEAARQQLHQVDSPVTLEQMIHRVFADWMIRIRVTKQPSAPQPAAETAYAAPRDRHVIARLRAFVEQVRRWRELAAHARRLRGAR